VIHTMPTQDLARLTKCHAKSMMGRAIFTSFAHSWLLRDSWVVVAFHRVNDQATDNDGLTCSVAMFERYCRFFSRFFRPLPLRTLVHHCEEGLPPRRGLAITFDDGYRDNHDHAAPILKKYNLPATFFVATHFIGTDFVPWWDRDLGIQRPWMTWEHVRALHRAGFEIGSHTRSHAELSTLATEEATTEIAGSRRDLEQQLSSEVVSFAFPYGREHQIAEHQRTLVREAGLRCCCSCYGGTNGRGSDPFHLRRVPVSSWYVSPYHFGLDLVLEHRHDQASHS
jgi:peptidoglycan/xylan/chitin deacetylase (PgdA/CDA1 family)